MLIYVEGWAVEPMVELWYLIYQLEMAMDIVMHSDILRSPARPSRFFMLRCLKGLLRLTGNDSEGDLRLEENIAPDYSSRQDKGVDENSSTPWFSWLHLSTSCDIVFDYNALCIVLLHSVP